MADKSHKSGTILIVEDDAGVATLERRRLESKGYRVVTAAAPEQAMQAVRKEGVDLILLDYRLPGIDGLDFYEQLKSAGYDPPVILVTGFPDEALVIRAMRMGARDFVTKSAEYLDYVPEAVARVLKQVRTERELADSRAMLSAVIGSARDAIIATDDGGRVMLFNASAESMFGCPAAEALGQPLQCFLPEVSAAAGATPAAVAGKGVKANGTEFPLEATLSYVHIGGRELSVVVVRDISERLKLEAQYRQALKMEAVGRLAGGIAHDFNNLLTVILGYSEVILGNLRPEDPWHNLVKEIYNAGDRAAGLTRQLLAFSRKQVLVPVVLDLNGVLTEMEKMLGRVIGEDIELRIAASPNLWPVKADAGQIEQVIMNLVVNSRDAMPRGGKLTIETRNIELDALERDRRPEMIAGSYVMLAVSDTGNGMDEATRALIFEPFFSTKGERGTGLGLATVYGIVKQSDGHIDVYSEPGLGTTFKIYLPRALEGAVPRKSSPGLQSARGGKETILLVEDEDGVRILMHMILKRLGYSLLDARNAQEAMQLFAQHRDAIKLLVSDVVLPQMSGPELGRKLSSSCPGLKILYLSGYTDDAIVRHGILDASVPFLQKPFRPEALGQKVRELLDQ